VAELPVPPGSATPYANERRPAMTTTSPSATTEACAIDDWVSQFRLDLAEFHEWAKGPKVAGLASRIIGGQYTASVDCDDRHDYDHALLLLDATGVHYGDELKTRDHFTRIAKFGEHVRLYVRCPR